MTNLTPIVKGIYKGINWRSLNFKEVVMADELEAEWRFYNSDYRSFLGLCDIGLDDYVRLKYKKTVYQHITRPFKISEYYISVSKYGNNRKVK